ncbi:MAG: arylamine N-acetyltransferase [Paucibacter sp.]|nr:arylamine N-acetyltransferase [Roseateles sp.]
MNIPVYLERIAYRGGLAPDLATLQALQLAHLRSVPFENLSIHAGQSIELEPAVLYRKIVEQGRGGFCYELNGLFALLLEALGFKLSRLSAQVSGSGGSFGPDFDHLCLLVHLERDYLVDVGFGDSFQQPLCLEPATDQLQGERSYRLSPQAEGGYILSARPLNVRPDLVPGEATPQYRFALTPHDLAAFEPMCRYHQSSADSHFTQKRICSLATPEGRVSLSDLRLIESRQGGARTETLLASEAEHAAALQQYFGLML